MKILHYIDEFDTIRLHPEYFEIIAAEQQEGEEVHLLMPKPDEGKMEIPGVQIHYLSYFSWFVWRNKRRFIKVMEELHPDVIHIHSCWSATAARIAKWNDKKYKCPYIVSTHKMMMPWHFRFNKLRRSLQTFLYLRTFLQNADAIHVDTSQETNIQSNPNVVIIENALYSPKCSHEKMRAKYRTLYNKIANSKPYLFMSLQEREFENALLKESVLPNRHERERKQTELTDTTRKIALHAIQQGTMSLLAPLLPADAKSYAENAPHFTSNNRFYTAPLREMKPQAHKSSLKTISQEEQAEANDILLCTMIINVHHEIVHDVISQRHLIELYQALIYTNFNEDTLNIMLQRLELHDDAARIMQILKEFFSLTEGYMPMEPINDSTTRGIIARLELLQIAGKGCAKKENAKQ